MGPERGLKGLDRFEEQMSHGEISRGRTGGQASHSLLDLNLFESRAGQPADERDVSRQVVVHVEDVAIAVRIQHTDLDHQPSYSLPAGLPIRGTGFITSATCRDGFSDPHPPNHTQQYHLP